jgi:hypothetical protein
MFNCNFSAWLATWASAAVLTQNLIDLVALLNPQPFTATELRKAGQLPASADEVPRNGSGIPLYFMYPNASTQNFNNPLTCLERG